MCFFAGICSAHYVCFDCRKVFRLRQDQQNRELRAPSSHFCPQCRTSMTNIGPYFKAPRHNDLRQWTKVRVLAERGVLYHPPSCCTWDGPGPRPRLLREVPEFLAPGRKSVQEELARHVQDTRCRYRRALQRRH